MTTGSTIEYRKAQAYLEEAVQAKRALNQPHGIAINLNNLGVVLARMGMYLEADAAFTEALTIFRSLGSRWGMGIWMLRRAAALADARHSTRSAQTWGAAKALMSVIGADMEAVDHAEYARARAFAGAEGAEAAWDSAELDGWQQPLDSALARAIEPMIPPHAGEPLERKAPTLPEGLSRREVEVLQLLAVGLTNAQIAQRLVLSPRTVQAHLYSVYQKLGVSTRHAAAHYARRHGLS